MTIGVVGRKAGMTRVFTEEGESIPVTVVSVEPNRVTQVKTVESDGYDAIQVTAGSVKANRVAKPLAGHFAKAATQAGRGLWEFRLEAPLQEPLELGALLKVDQFGEGQKVDVSGVSKGKGYGGVIKRWNFKMQDATHGNSLSHRAPGSIGMCQTPGRVFKGKKMAGQLGNVRVTTQNLTVIRVDTERNLLLIKGAVPGAPGGDVYIRPAVKAGAAGMTKGAAGMTKGDA
jgi:large subunit ribosomal protein L3